MNFYNRRRGMKFGSKRVEADGHSFASKLESAVYTVLKARENAKEIKILQVQDHVYLTRARICYIPDFKCLDISSGKEFHVEAKGFQTPEWSIKKRLWKCYGPGNLEIWRGNHMRPFLDEVITPERGDDD